MSGRALTTVILAVVLIVVVMAVASAITLAGFANTTKFTYQSVWSQPFPEAQSLKIIDLTGDRQDDLFAQGTSTVAVFDSSGREIFSRAFASPVTTLGDVNADGVEDVVVFDGAGVTALTGLGETLWQAQPPGLGQPYRAAVIRFARGAQIVLGDGNGQLVALAGDGREIWRAGLSGGDYIRGLDDVKVEGATLLAAANHDGTVGAFTDQGRALWTYSLGGPLRRLRAYDLDGDGRGEILVGGDSGRLVMLDAGTGQERFSQSLGQTITEIREVEIDGDPASREFVVGGKEGGLWAFGASRRQLWSASLSDRVNEIAGVDVDDDGAEEVVVGDDSGTVAIFAGRSGSRRTLKAWPTGIGRIDAGRLTGSDQIVVADASTVELLSLEQASAPIWYTPLLGGLALSAVIVFAAWFVASIPPKPTLRAAAEDQSAEGLLARHRMLHESLADVDRLKRSGEMPSEAYLARLKDLRGQLAETEASLRKAGQPVKLETFTCPHCGGTLPLGLDRCDYCGQVVIA